MEFTGVAFPLKPKFGDWIMPLIVLLVVWAAMMGGGWVIGRNRYV
ncbi:cyanate permease [Streptomyces sp. SAI-133]|nr:hypothetical protein [Streptomyces sp. SAI-133]MDH6581500.1 cyanate permease [Streptomyces sp. SAI-133]